MTKILIDREIIGKASQFCHFVGGNGELIAKAINEVLLTPQEPLERQWLSPNQPPPVKRTNRTWDESDRVIVRIKHGEEYAAFARYIHSTHSGYEWNIEGHSGDWHDRVIGWAPLPSIGGEHG